MHPAVLLTISPASLSGQQEAHVDWRDFVAWAREIAVQLNLLELRETDSTVFVFLDEALKGKRIVFLGESDHFVAERMEFRLPLIRQLVRRGFRSIGMEMGLSDGKRIDHYLETGDESWLDGSRSAATEGTSARTRLQVGRTIRTRSSRRLS